MSHFEAMNLLLDAGYRALGGGRMYRAELADGSTFEVEAHYLSEAWGAAEHLSFIYHDNLRVLAVSESGVTP